MHKYNLSVSYSFEIEDEQDVLSFADSLMYDLKYSSHKATVTNISVYKEADYGGVERAALRPTSAASPESSEDSTQAEEEGMEVTEHNPQAD